MFRLYLKGGHVIEATDVKVASTPEYNEEVVSRIPDLLGGGRVPGKTVALFDAAGQLSGYVLADAIEAYESTGEPKKFRAF
jgi:hypothetical protein